MTEIGDGLHDLIEARTGHFGLESGHHGSLRLDLDSLFVSPARIEPFAGRLAERVAAHDVEIVCGPLTGGAFLARLVALRLARSFIWSVPSHSSGGDQLYSRLYDVPQPLHVVRGRRVAVVDDVINAGSAVLATAATLSAAGADVVLAAALLTLGDVGANHLRAAGIQLETLAHRDKQIWIPQACPLCAAGVSLESLGS